MKLSLVLFLSFFSQCAFAEGGVGVKNGGSAISCPPYGQTLKMLEVEEAFREAQFQMPLARIVNYQDRDVFFSYIFARLAAVGTKSSETLAIKLQQALRLHGPSTLWTPSPYHEVTILLEDWGYADQARRVDYFHGTVLLKNGCTIIPVSYLTPLVVGAKHPLPPQVIPETYRHLDGFNRNVLELHEALYEILITQSFELTVLPVRRLIRMMLSNLYTDAQLGREIDNFVRSSWIRHPLPIEPN